ncbi:hypothetical protein GCM10011348_41520 [Marinobacterium nitratireducens]|uniref:Uncharacterized protein n=1 Tax=Marinobacterium nitratireducens TaxID=518897 RepID=A0A918DWJ3_9GAMM|nr:hypothetical protein GCM10011348_41520 [Marinobacterium nitratireducens]
MGRALLRYGHDRSPYRPGIAKPVKSIAVQIDWLQPAGNRKGRCRCRSSLRKRIEGWQRAERLFAHRVGSYAWCGSGAPPRIPAGCRAIRREARLLRIVPPVTRHACPPITGILKR